MLSYIKNSLTAVAVFGGVNFVNYCGPCSESCSFSKDVEDIANFFPSTNVKALDLLNKKIDIRGHKDSDAFLFILSCIWDILYERQHIIDDNKKVLDSLIKTGKENNINILDISSIEFNSFSCSEEYIRILGLIVGEMLSYTIKDIEEFAFILDSIQFDEDIDFFVDEYESFGDQEFVNRTLGEYKDTIKWFLNKGVIDKSSDIDTSEIPTEELDHAYSRSLAKFIISITRGLSINEAFVDGIKMRCSNVDMDLFEEIMKYKEEFQKDLQRIIVFAYKQMANCVHDDCKYVNIVVPNNLNTVSIPKFICEKSNYKIPEDCALIKVDISSNDIVSEKYMGTSAIWIANISDALFNIFMNTFVQTSKDQEECIQYASNSFKNGWKDSINKMAYELSFGNVSIQEKIVEKILSEVRDSFGSPHVSPASIKSSYEFLKYLYGDRISNDEPPIKLGAVQMKVPEAAIPIVRKIGATFLGSTCSSLAYIFGLEEYANIEDIAWKPMYKHEFEKRSIEIFSTIKNLHNNNMILSPGEAILLLSAFLANKAKSSC